MSKKKKKVVLEASSSSAKGGVLLSNGALAKSKSGVSLLPFNDANESKFSDNDDLCSENGSTKDSTPSSSNSSVFSDDMSTPVSENKHDESCPQTVCKIATVKTAAMNDMCRSADCANDSKNFEETENVSDPDPFINNFQDTRILSNPKGINNLNPTTAPYIPGSIDAIINACGGQASIRPATLTSLNKDDDALGRINIATSKPVGGNNQQNAWARPLPKVWSRLSPTVFSNHEEPQESYKRNGIIAVDEDEAASIMASYENVLVGRMVGTNFKFEWLESQLLAKWGGYKGFKVEDLGVGCFLLHFASRECRDKVWMGGPWHVAGCLVGLDVWNGKFIPSMNPNMQVPTWIRAPGLPLHFWGEKTLRRIAVEIGEPIYIDAFTKTREKPSFARFCVRRNLAKPLVGGVWLYSKSTRDFFQKLIYEDIGSLCTSCGLAGHGDEACKAKPDRGEDNVNGAGINNPLEGLDEWTLVVPKKPPPKNFHYQSYGQQENKVWQQKMPQKENKTVQEKANPPTESMIPDHTIIKQPQVARNTVSNIRTASEVSLEVQLDKPASVEATFDVDHPVIKQREKPRRSHSRKARNCDSDENNRKISEKTADDYIDDSHRRGRSRSRKSHKGEDVVVEAEVTVKKKRNKSKRHGSKEKLNSDVDDEDAGETPTQQ